MLDLVPVDRRVAEILSRVRQRLATRRAGETSVHLEQASAEEAFRGLRPYIDWHQLVAGLRLADEHAAAGTYVPELTRLPGPLRRLAQLIARGILLATAFITNRQRAYNQATLGTIRNVHGALRHLEQVEKENLLRLERVVARQNELLADLREQVRQLQTALSQVTNPAPQGFKEVKVPSA